MLKRIPLLQNDTQRYALAGVSFGLLFPILGTFIRMTVSHLPPDLSSAMAVQSRDSLLWIIDTAPFFLGLFASFAGRRQDNLRKLNTELGVREQELRAIRSTLEERVVERTRELSEANRRIEKRAEQLRLIAEAARSAISIPDFDRLLPSAAQLISQRFNVYHVGIFLLDDQRQFAVLRASNSEGGKRMLERGHRLRVGQQGIVGFVAQGGQPRRASDVGEDPTFFNNPDLPETSSEIALPLKSGNVIIGVLDIQSTDKNAFSDDDVSTLGILADQIAIAVQNAVSHDRSQRALREAEVASQQASRSSWRRFAETIRTRGYRYDGVRVEAVKEAQRSSEENGALFVPVKLRGQTIGRLRLKPAEAARRWTEDEIAMAEATAERVALALDGARLLEDAQKRARREAFLSEVAAKLSTSFQLDSILRDTVEELGQNLKGSTVSFQLVNPLAPPSPESPGPDGAPLTGNPAE